MSKYKNKNNSDNEKGVKCDKPIILKTRTEILENLGAVCNETSNALGFDFLNNYNLPYDYKFNEDEINESFSNHFNVQKHAFPFSNKQISSFIKMKKFPINFPIINKRTHFTNFSYLMVGKEESGKIVLFNYSFCTDNSIRSKSKFNIQLHMNVGGHKDGWMNLLRYDAKGSKHVNKISCGNLCENLPETLFPHIHIPSQVSEVFFQTAEKIGESSCHTVKKIREKIISSENYNQVYDAFEFFNATANIPSKKKILAQCFNNKQFDNLFNSIGLFSSTDGLLQCIEQQSIMQTNIFKENERGM